MRDAVMAQREGEPGVDDMAEAGGGFRGPIPEWKGDIRLIIAVLPCGVGAQGLAERGGFFGAERLP